MSQLEPIIIIGGGPVGLATALAFEKAGIDFVLLEKKDNVVVGEGGDLVLLPPAIRALSQLGVLEDIRKASTRLRTISRLDHKGRGIGEMNWFINYRKSFGQYPLLVPRTKLSEILFNHLPKLTQRKVYLNKKVTKLELHPGGFVRVTCRDNTKYTGGLVIGADGVDSRVREEMRKLALGAAHRKKLRCGPVAFVNKERPFKSRYNALWMVFPPSICDTLRAGDAIEVHGKDVAVQLFIGRDRATLTAYRNNDLPTKEKILFDEDYIKSFVDSCGDLAIVPGGKLTLRTAFDNRMESGMASMPEGVLKHWSYRKIVLAGDAAHQVTPSVGSGVNHGIFDVVSLVNELRKLLAEHGTTPAMMSGMGQHDDELADALRTYQHQRIPVVKECGRVSGKVTGLSVWSNPLSRIGDRTLSWDAIQNYLWRKSALMMAKSPRFNFIKTKEPFSTVATASSLINHRSEYPNDGNRVSLMYNTYERLY